jgi:hypothetical protein
MEGGKGDDVSALRGKRDPGVGAWYRCYRGYPAHLYATMTMYVAWISKVKGNHW